MSNEVKEFNSGALRGSDPPQYRLITEEFLYRIAQALTKGLEKYPNHEDGLENWKHGDRAFAQAAYDHAMQHLLTWKEAGEYPKAGDDHLAHAACNLMFLMWFETLGVWDPWAEENRRDVEEQLVEVPAAEEPPPEDMETRVMSVMEARLRKMLHLPLPEGGE